MATVMGDDPGTTDDRLGLSGEATGSPWPRPQPEGYGGQPPLAGFDLSLFLLLTDWGQSGSLR